MEGQAVPELDMISPSHFWNKFPTLFLRLAIALYFLVLLYHRQATNVATNWPVQSLNILFSYVARLEK